MQNEKKVYSIKELNRYIKMLFDSDSLLQHVWVRGEISNFTHHSSGHMYFTLKDKDSRVKCVMFASKNQRLPFIPREGSLVIACGYVSIYERDGQYQFYVSEMQPDGIGSLYLAFEQLKKKLEAEGLFSPERKKPLPRFPKAIGVVTSPTGAAIRDILTTLQRRFPLVPVIIYPVAVQGIHAVPSIVKALKVMNERQEVDVIILGRGGGSLEELWAFNEEEVARSIYASRIPIISAVGHETDFTISDFVADVRAATPTAAAELAVPHHLELKQQIYYCQQRLHRALVNELDKKRERLERLRRSPQLKDPRRMFMDHAERLDRLYEKMRFQIRAKIARDKENMIKLERALSVFNPEEQIRFSKKRVQTLQHQLRQSMHTLLREKRHLFTMQVRHLDALSPLKVMQRGYSLVYDEQESRLIKSIEQIQLGDLLKIRLSDGRIDCHVWSMEGENHDG